MNLLIHIDFIGWTCHYNLHICFNSCKHSQIEWICSHIEMKKNSRYLQFICSWTTDADVIRPSIVYFACNGFLAFLLSCDICVIQQRSSVTSEIKFMGTHFQSYAYLWYTSIESINTLWGDKLITMQSYERNTLFKSPANRLFVQDVVQNNRKEALKFRITGPLRGTSTGDRWMPPSKGQ